MRAWRFLRLSFESSHSVCARILKGGDIIPTWNLKIALLGLGLWIDFRKIFPQPRVEKVLGFDLSRHYFELGILRGWRARATSDKYRSPSLLISFFSKGGAIEDLAPPREENPADPDLPAYPVKTARAVAIIRGFIAAMEKARKGGTKDGDVAWWMTATQTGTGALEAMLMNWEDLESKAVGMDEESRDMWLAPARYLLDAAAVSIAGMTGKDLNTLNDEQPPRA